MSLQLESPSCKLDLTIVCYAFEIPVKSPILQDLVLNQTLYVYRMML